jgi:deoxyribonuclease-4
MKKQSTILLGAHTSAAGGVFNALYEGREIGATTIQLFTSNQRQWHSRSLSQETIEHWLAALKETGLEKIMSHDSYLINLGAPASEVLVKSRHAFREELIRCLQLGISYLNFHPGSALQAGKEPCLNRIVNSLLEVQDLFQDHVGCRLLIETTAGQGSTIGAAFEEIAFIIERVKEKVPIGVCIDTCHIFAAGYDIRDAGRLKEVLKEFDQVIGLEHLYAMHLNDSLGDLGSRLDRHAPIGEGKLGLEAFRAIMQEPQLAPLPKYLETPGGPDAWKKEIPLLRSFAELA